MKWWFNRKRRALGRLEQERGWQPLRPTQPLEPPTLEQQQARLDSQIARLEQIRLERRLERHRLEHSRLEQSPPQERLPPPERAETIRKLQKIIDDSRDP